MNKHRSIRFYAVEKLTFIYVLITAIVIFFIRPSFEVMEDLLRARLLIILGILSLAYLSLFGTVIAYWAYQTLVGTIGAERAAYTSIINPVIAMLISTMFENINFTPQIFLGILLCFAGNFVALKKRNQLPRPA